MTTTDHADTEETPMHVRTPQTHAQPTGDGAAVTPCCGRHPAELPGGDRVLAHPLDAFCPGVLDSARLHGDAVDEFDAHDQLLAGILRRALHRNLSIRHRGGGMVRVHVGPVDLRSAADADVLDVLRFHASEAVTDDEETDNFEPGADDRDELTDVLYHVLERTVFAAAKDGTFDVLNFSPINISSAEADILRRFLNGIAAEQSGAEPADILRRCIGDIRRCIGDIAAEQSDAEPVLEPGGDDRVLADLFRRVIRHPHFRAEEAAEGHFVLQFPSMTADPEETRAVRGAWCAKPDIYGPWRPGTS